MTQSEVMPQKFFLSITQIGVHLIQDGETSNGEANVEMFVILVGFILQAKILH
jgi:hypothetical protein